MDFIEKNNFNKGIDTDILIGSDIEKINTDIKKC